VTDTARARASRRNGRKSEGPKTLAGKLRVARNAQRHGLSLPVLLDPALSREVEDLARRYAGADPAPRRHELAGRIAEAQVDVMRVRVARLPLLERVESDRDALALLVRLSRYERRALSRRKSAIWAFAAAGKDEDEFGRTNLGEKIK